MKTAAELQVVRWEQLHQLCDGFRRGELTHVVRYLAEDCVLQSQWEETSLYGREAVSAYLREQGETIKQTGRYPYGKILELIGGIHSLKIGELYIGEEIVCPVLTDRIYPAGELCLGLWQPEEKAERGTLLRICLDEAEQISQIDLCRPELFRYRSYTPEAALVPGREYEENEGGEIWIGNHYYDGLALFLSLEVEDCDPYLDWELPMSQWRRVLDAWERFFAFESFDEAFEDACGIDYGSFTARKPRALEDLSVIGDSLWRDRTEYQRLVRELRAWTEVYGKRFDFLCCCYYGSE